MSQQVKAVGVRAWSTLKKPDVVLCICHPNILIRRWKTERKICPKLTGWALCGSAEIRGRASTRR